MAEGERAAEGVKLALDAIVPRPSILHPDQKVVPYEERLAADFGWALGEGSSHFEGNGSVQKTLRKIARLLHQLGIPYAVAGGMALFVHGLRRFTENVDILVTLEGLRAIHRQREILGCVVPFTGSKNLREVETGVKSAFMITGQFPGDGKPKPVSFPDPKSAAIERDGIQYLNLPTLIELKLASGMTNLRRMKDLSDVQELLKLLEFSDDFFQQLNPFVQDKFNEMRLAVIQAPSDRE